MVDDGGDDLLYEKLNHVQIRLLPPFNKTQKNHHRQRCSYAAAAATAARVYVL